MELLVVLIILLFFYQRSVGVCAAQSAQCKRQQSIGTPPTVNASTTCKGKGPIQARTPLSSPPTNAPIPTGVFVSDNGQSILVATANAAYIAFKDAYGNLIQDFQIQNGQTVPFTYGNCVPCSGWGGNGYGCACCGSADTRIAGITLQGPGGSTNIANPYYRAASAAQCTGKLFTCSCCICSLQVPGTAFMGETGTLPKAVHGGQVYNERSAAAIVSPANLAGWSWSACGAKACAVKPIPVETLTLVPCR